MATKTFRSLAEISRRTSTVHDIPVYSLRARALSQLFQRFPALRAMVSGKFDIEAIFEQAPDAVAAIIAAGIDKLGDKETEAMAGDLDIDIQADFLAEIGKVTFPNGIAALADKIRAVTGVAAEDADQSVTTS